MELNCTAVLVGIVSFEQSCRYIANCKRFLKYICQIWYHHIAWFHLQCVFIHLLNGKWVHALVITFVICFQFVAAAQNPWEHSDC